MGKRDLGTRNPESQNRDLGTESAHLTRVFDFRKDLGTRTKQFWRQKGEDCRDERSGVDNPPNNS